MRPALQIPIIRVVFWIVAVVLGLAQAWASRHVIFSDGISYTDVATAYLAGDWQNAINAYWSPLYSWAIALAYLIIHPAPYWQSAVLHLINFCAYLASLFAFEFFFAELLLFRSGNTVNATERLPPPVLYVAGYCTILFAGLSLIGMGFCSPDMVAMALMLAITALLMQVSRLGSSSRACVLLGSFSGVFFLARTAFVPTFLVCLIVSLFLLRGRREALLRPAAIIVGCFVLIASPFIIAISIKTGHFTIGEAGTLNYGWEIAGATRYAHWQGEPSDIGVPKHTTTLVNLNPRAYVFTRQLAGTYPPWFNPAFWYDGIKPRMKLGHQLRVLFVNLTVLCNLLVRSPVLLSSLILIPLAGFRRWRFEILTYWPVLLPSLAAVALYSIVYVEKRYIAGNFVIIWMVLLTSIRFRQNRVPRWVPSVVSAFCLLYTAAFVIHRQTDAVKVSLHDLIHREEQDGNFSFLMAEQIRKLGLQSSDRVAVIGPAVEADWARLDHLKIVGEIPLTYKRNELPFNNTLIYRTDDIKKFWTSDQATQTKILNSFRDAGVKLVVADGFYSPKLSSKWPSLFDKNEPHFPKPDPVTGDQPNFRYLLLSGTKSSSEFSTSNGESILDSDRHKFDRD